MTPVTFYLKNGYMIGICYFTDLHLKKIYNGIIGKYLFLTYHDLYKVIV